MKTETELKLHVPWVFREDATDLWIEQMGGCMVLIIPRPLFSRHVESLKKDLIFIVETVNAHEELKKEMAAVRKHRDEVSAHWTNSNQELDEMRNANIALRAELEHQRSALYLLKERHHGRATDNDIAVGIRRIDAVLATTPRSAAPALQTLNQTLNRI